MMSINRVWAMPNKWTFQIKPIKELVGRYVGDGNGWIDPFAGMNSPAKHTNDLNPDMPTDEHMDALDFLKQQTSNSYDGVIFDPPYSFAQLLKSYKGVGKDNNRWGEHNAFWSKCKNEVARITKVSGLSISFGWNSVGIGKSRGYEIEEILLVCHGSVRNDTIVTVERKVLASPITSPDGDPVGRLTRGFQATPVAQTDAASESPIIVINKGTNRQERD